MTFTFTANVTKFGLRPEALSQFRYTICVFCDNAYLVKFQPTIGIYGDIEDPKLSVSDISLSYPPYELTIVETTLHNGKWSGFRLLATKGGEDTNRERRERKRCRGLVCQVNARFRPLTGTFSSKASSVDDGLILWCVLLCINTGSLR